MASAIFLQTLAEPAAQAAKADVLKERQHLAVVETKEVASAAVNVEAATGNKVETIAGDQVVRAQVTNAVAEAVRVARIVVVDQVQVVAVQVEIVRAVQERDSNSADLRFEI